MSDLFDGVDEGDDELTDNDQPPLDGADPIGPGEAGLIEVLARWFRDLTYDEIHAFVMGFGPMLVGLVLLPFFPALSTVFVGLAGLTSSMAIVDSHKPTRPLRYLVREPHYTLGGAAIAALLGVVWIGVVDLALTLASTTPAVVGLLPIPDVFDLWLLACLVAGFELTYSGADRRIYDALRRWWP